MKIVISDSLPTSAADLLRDAGWTVDARAGRPIDELKHALADADGLIVRSATKVDADLIAAAPQLRVVARAGSGVDNVDLEAASKRGILVLNAPGANSVSVAEHACALMLTLARSIALADAQMKNGRWEKKSLQGAELRGKTLGVVGLGRIGREVVRRTRAFEMRIIAHDPYISSQVAADLDVELVSIDALCERSDFITLHIPSASGTERLLNKERLARCKPGVRIINTARGTLVDETALAEAIASGHVAGAGLDVYEQEPPPDTRLTGLPQVVATPHIAASTKEAQELVGLETATCVREYLRSGVVRNAVNFSSVSAEEFKRLQPYLALSERLGSFLAQLTDERIEGVGIRYYGDLAGQSHDMLVGAVLVGLFRTVLSSPVTLVNARSVAEQRGLEVIESHSSRARNFTSLVSIKLLTGHGERWAEGAVFEPNQPRLVLLDGVEVEAPLAGTLVVMRNNDQPGVIGDVGTILGNHRVNIATFALGRAAEGAVGVVSIEGSSDSEDVGGEILEEIRRLEAVQRVSLVRL
jgi:D-3-phosphoglycerate dehydrogenase